MSDSKKLQEKWKRKFDRKQEATRKKAERIANSPKTLARKAKWDEARGWDMAYLMVWERLKNITQDCNHYRGFQDSSEGRLFEKLNSALYMNFLYYERKKFNIMIVVSTISMLAIAAAICAFILKIPEMPEVIVGLLEVGWIVAALIGVNFLYIKEVKFPYFDGKLYDCGIFLCFINFISLYTLPLVRGLFQLTIKPLLCRIKIATIPTRIRKKVIMSTAYSEKRKEGILELLDECEEILSHVKECPGMGMVVLSQKELYELSKRREN